MNNYDLLQILGEIDDGMLERTARFRERRDRILTRRIRLPYRQIGLAAACLILLLCAVPVVKRLMNGVTPGVIPPDSQPVTNVVENPDFVIENGVLLSYVGNDPHVVVPDEVVEISRDAFAEKGDIIDTITIGKNVEVIDHLFLSKVDHLSNIVVSAENENYEFIDGVFTDRNNVFFVDTENRYHDDVNSFYDVILQMKDSMRFNGQSITIVIDRVSVVVSFCENGTDHEGNVKYAGFLDKILFNDTVFNVTAEYGDRYFQIGSTGGRIRIHQTDDVAMLSATANGAGDFLLDRGYYFLLTKDKAYNLTKPHSDEAVNNEYNRSLYFYKMDEEGTVIYMRLPEKFYYAYSTEELIEGMRYITGFDEFYKEIGWLSIKNGTVVYNRTEALSIEEAGMKEKYLDAFKQCQGKGYFQFDTIEELFKYNKTICESAK